MGALRLIIGAAFYPYPACFAASVRMNAEVVDSSVLDCGAVRADVVHVAALSLRTLMSAPK